VGGFAPRAPDAHLGALRSASLRVAIAGAIATLRSPTRPVARLPRRRGSRLRLDVSAPGLRPSLAARVPACAPASRPPVFARLGCPIVAIRQQIPLAHPPIHGRKASVRFPARRRLAACETGTFGVPDAAL